jgi:hypothetical protein
MIPWLVVSSNRLNTIRQEFYALPRPIVDHWQTVTQRGPALFLGNADLEGTSLVLSASAEYFVTNNMALATNQLCQEEEVGIAIWPILLDTNYSGDATAILVRLQDNPFTTQDFQETGYMSPTNRGTWDVDGAEVRTWLRWELRGEWWLDAYGIPVAFPGGKRQTRGLSQGGFDLTNCTDEASTPP